MSPLPEESSPKRLDDLSHLFFSHVEQGGREEEPLPPSPPPRPEKERLARAGSRGPAWSPEQLVKRLCASGRRLFGTTRIVEAGMREAMGADMVLEDEHGDPALLVILRNKPEEIPFRILHLQSEWAAKRSLFLRAFPRFLPGKPKRPALLFLAPRFPRAVIGAVAAMNESEVRLFEVRDTRLGNRTGLLIHEILPEPDGPCPGAFYAHPLHAE